MSCRRYGSKPTVAFWMLIAIADSAMLVATVGAAIMIMILAGVALVAGGVLAARTLTRRNVPATRSVVRRRA
jgi:hypothetical protein